VCAWSPAWYWADHWYFFLSLNVWSPALLGIHVPGALLQIVWKENKCVCVGVFSFFLFGGLAACVWRFGTVLWKIFIGRFGSEWILEQFSFRAQVGFGVFWS
jgi:hypothetical protein